MGMEIHLRESELDQSLEKVGKELLDNYHRRDFRGPEYIGRIKRPLDERIMEIGSLLAGALTTASSYSKVLGAVTCCNLLESFYVNYDFELEVRKRENPAKIEYLKGLKSHDN